MTGDGSWTRQEERGSAFWVRFMIGVSLRMGWSAAHMLLLPITAYFFLTGHRARGASRLFLTRALGRPAGWRDVFRHFHAFSTANLDRVFFLADRLDRFKVEVRGLELLTGLVEEKRGCVLLGAHLGSFEALRVVARQSPVPVRPVMYRRNTGIVTRLFEALDPQLAPSVIEIGTPEAMLQVAESVARGEFVGVLADRTPNAAQKTVWVPFLGLPAPLPAGPFILAAALHAPTLLFFAVRTGRRHYTISFELFADEVVIARERRQQDLEAWISRYAARLEAMTRAHPFNWFNFFDFWEQPSHAATDAKIGVGLSRAASGPVPVRTAGDLDLASQRVGS